MTSDSVWPASSSWLTALRSLARVQRWSILTWPSTPGPPAARAGFYWIFGTVASQRRTRDLLGRPGTVADPASRKGLALWPAILVAPTENASNAPLRAQRDERSRPTGWLRLPQHDQLPAPYPEPHCGHSTAKINIEWEGFRLPGLRRFYRNPVRTSVHRAGV